MTVSSSRFLQLLKARLFRFCLATLVVTSVLSSGFQVLHLAPHPLLGPDITLLWRASYVAQQVINVSLSLRVNYTSYLFLKIPGENLNKSPIVSAVIPGPKGHFPHSQPDLLLGALQAAWLILTSLAPLCLAV